MQAGFAISSIARRIPTWSRPATSCRDLESQMPGQWRVVARRPRFLAKGEIVVLAPQVLLHLGKHAGPRGSKLL